MGPRFVCHRYSNITGEYEDIIFIGEYYSLSLKEKVRGATAHKPIDHSQLAFGVIIPCHRQKYTIWG